MGLFRRRRDRTEPGTVPDAPRSEEPPELVEFPVGRDRTSAAMVVARCEAEGIPARLIDGDGGMPGAIGMGYTIAEHRVLIRSDDRERVEDILRNR